MATGAGIGGVIKITMTLVALVAMFRRRRKPTEPTEADKDFDTRRTAKADMERRMAAYLASRDSDAVFSAAPDLNNKENER